MPNVIERGASDHGLDVVLSKNGKMPVERLDDESTMIPAVTARTGARAHLVRVKLDHLVPLNPPDVCLDPRTDFALQPDDAR